MHSALYPNVPVWMRISDNEIWYMLEALEEGSSYADIDRALQLGRGCAYGKHLRMIESGEIEE